MYAFVRLCFNAILYFYILNYTFYFMYVIVMCAIFFVFFFFSSRRRHTRCSRDWSSDVCSSDLVAGLYRRLREIGGYKGEFPISCFEWCVTCSLDTLAARLALQNRTFEAGELDLLGQLPAKWRGAGDEKKDRESTRLNSSHGYNSYAGFCLKKKKNIYVTCVCRTLY